MSDRISTRVTPDAFVQALWAEVERHPAVAHPFLRRFAEGRLAPWQIWGYASQHYRLVGSFTAHLEAIAGLSERVESDMTWVLDDRRVWLIGKTPV